MRPRTGSICSRCPSFIIKVARRSQPTSPRKAEVSEAATHSPLIGVIIPFFQRKRGLLSACVRSILAQQGAFKVYIAIVDDASPIPATEELNGLLDRPEIKIVRQPNRGPGAARNTALDHLPPETDYVALMDSDDTWKPGFLQGAVTAMNYGCDLFFADSRRYEQEKSRFNWNADSALNLRSDQHKTLDPNLEIYLYQGDFFDFIVRRSNILGPSTTIYRRSVAPDLRFSEKLFNGQDRLFKLMLCETVQKAAFTPKIYAEEGEGINIFDSAAWGSAKSLSLLGSYISLSKEILLRIRLSPSQRDHVKRHLSETRRSFAASLLHLLLRRQAFDSSLVWKTFRNDPTTALLLLPNLLKSVVRKFNLRRNQKETVKSSNP